MDMQTNQAAAAPSTRTDHAAREAYRAPTKRGFLVLVLAVGALTAAAVYGDLPYAGLLALVLMFAGGPWVALRRLRWEAMRFRAE